MYTVALKTKFFARLALFSKARKKIVLKSAMFVYLLQSTIDLTYIGATVYLERRLRQHNGELVGGAKATKGQVWKRICYVSGFPTWNDTLKFEWRWKKLSTKQKGSPLERRRAALAYLLTLDRSTKTALPFAEWAPTIHWEEK